MSEPQKFLEDWQLDVVNYIEKVHSTTSTIPSDSAIIEYIRENYISFSGTLELDNLKINPLFKASLESRGLIVNYSLDAEFYQVNALSSRQMAAAAVMMNITDRRSNEKKLKDIGVSTEEWTNWLQNKQFSEYLRERAEVLIDNSIHEAHLGLMRGVQQGNTASLQLYYKLTGRYDPDAESNVNIRLVIGRVLEAIQKHVRNPETLNALAVEMSQIAIESSSSPVARSSVISASTRKEII